MFDGIIGVLVSIMVASTMSTVQTEMTSTQAVEVEQEVTKNIVTVEAGQVKYDINADSLVNYDAFMADEELQSVVADAMFGMEADYVPETFQWRDGQMRVDVKSVIHDGLWLIIDTKMKQITLTTNGYLDNSTNMPEVPESGQQSKVYGTLASMSPKEIMNNNEILIENYYTGKTVKRSIEKFDHDKFDEAWLPKWTGTHENDCKVYADASGKKLYIPYSLDNTTSNYGRNQEEADNMNMFLATNIGQKPHFVYGEYYNDRYIGTVRTDYDKLYVLMLFKGEGTDDSLYIIQK